MKKMTRKDEYVDLLSKLKKLPKVSGIAHYINNVMDVQWNIAMEYSIKNKKITDPEKMDFIVGHFANEIQAGFYREDVPLTFLPIVSVNEHWGFKVLLLVHLGSKGPNEYEAEYVSCDSYKSYCNFQENQEDFKYESAQGELRKFIDADGLKKVIRRHECDGELHYLPYAAQIRPAYASEG